MPSYLVLLLLWHLTKVHVKILFKVKTSQISIEYSELLSFKIDLDCHCDESIGKCSLMGTELFLFQRGQVRSFIIPIPVHLLNGKRRHTPHGRCIDWGKVGVYCGKLDFHISQPLGYNHCWS